MRKQGFLVMAILAVWAASAQAASHINSHYRITGARMVAPVQVFDNATRTYLQMRAGGVMHPSVISEEGEPIVYVTEGPYLILPGIYSRFSIRYGAELTAEVVNTEASRAAQKAPVETREVASPKLPDSQGAVSSGLAVPRMETGRADPPVRRDVPQPATIVQPPAKAAEPVEAPEVLATKVVPPEAGVDLFEFKVETEGAVRAEHVLRNTLTLAVDERGRLSPEALSRLFQFVDKQKEHVVTAPTTQACQGVQKRIVSMGIGASRVFCEIIEDSELIVRKLEVK